MILGTVQFGLDYSITNKTGKVTEQELYKIYYFDTNQYYGVSEIILLKYKKIFPNIQIITKAIEVYSN